MAIINYLDFDVAIEPIASAPGSYRARVFDSPVGQAGGEFALPFSSVELENYILKMGRPRRSVRSMHSSEGVAALEFGQKLYNAIFQAQVRDCLRRSLDTAARQGGQGLRLRLHLADAPALADLPWEYLYDTTVRRFFSHSIATPIVRYLDLQEGIAPLAVQPPFKVLVMIASPKDYVQLDVEAEWRRVQGALAGLVQRGLMTLTRLETATLAELQRHLRRSQYHIFHFIGHGGFDQQTRQGVLLLEDENGLSRRVSGPYLGTLLHDHASLRLALLNACEGARTSLIDPFAGVAQHLVLQGIPAVIAMQFEITDKAAITLAQEFYAALADGYPVDAALAEARKAIFTQGNDIEWGTPVLYMRSQDGQIFDTGLSPVADLPQETLKDASTPKSEREPPKAKSNSEPAEVQRQISPTSAAQSSQAGSNHGQLHIEPTEIAVDPGSQVTLKATIINDSNLVAGYTVGLIGIPSTWVMVTPNNYLQLMPAERGIVEITIRPPRSTETRAGRFRVDVEAIRRDIPAQALKAKATLKIGAYGQFKSELRQTKAPVGDALSVLVDNQTNKPETFIISCWDEANELDFIIPHKSIDLSAGEGAALEFSAQPRVARWLGGPKEYSFKVKISSKEGREEVHSGTLISKGFPPSRMPRISIGCQFVITALALILVSFASLTYRNHQNVISTQTVSAITATQIASINKLNTATAVAANEIAIARATQTAEAQAITTAEEVAMASTAATSIATHQASASQTAIAATAIVAAATDKAPQTVIAQNATAEAITTEQDAEKTAVAGTLTALPATTPTVQVPALTPVPSRPGLVTDFGDFGVWTRGSEAWGTFTQSTEKTYVDSYAGKVMYDFSSAPAEQSSVVFLHKPPLPLSGHPKGLRMQVYGDSSGNILNAWVQDNRGKIWQFTFGKISHSGWQEMEAPFDLNFGWPNVIVQGNQGEGLSYPLSLYALILDGEPRHVLQGTVFFDELLTTDNPSPPNMTDPKTNGDFAASVTIICNDKRREVWFEGTVTINGQPQNGVHVAFKSTKVPGTEPATDPAITGPTGEHGDWSAGYYSHIVDGDKATAKDKPLEVWVMDNAGNRISDYGFWHTDGAGGTCNKAIINFSK